MRREETFCKIIFYEIIMSIALDPEKCWACRIFRRKAGERRARGRFYCCGSEKRAVLERTRSNRFSPWFYRRPCAGLGSLVHFLGFPRIASCAIVAYFAPEYSQLHATTDVIVVGMTLAGRSSLGPCRFRTKVSHVPAQKLGKVGPRFYCYYA